MNVDKSRFDRLIAYVECRVCGYRDSVTEVPDDWYCPSCGRTYVRD